MFEYLKKYIVEQEIACSNEKHIFYKMLEEDIRVAEKRIKKNLPNEIRAFYKEIGYGYFYDKDECYINVLMKPQDIADFVCGEGNYFYAEEREFLGKEDLVFFEIEPNIHIHIRINGINKGKIYLGRKEIAASFEEFIKNLDIDSNYYFS